LEEKLRRLREILREVYALRRSAALLWWDQATKMPPGGAAGRGEQLATLGRLAHERFTSEEVGELLEALAPVAKEMPYDSDEAALIRVTKRLYERETRKPAEFVARLARHTSESYAVWRRARPENDFVAVAPYLERSLELGRELAGFYEHEHIADPLIAESDYGMNTKRVRKLFSELREALVPLVAEITEKPPVDDSCLLKELPAQEQLAFAAEMVSHFGYDFSSGRQDLTAHPFAVKVSTPQDVRITTRIRPGDLRDPLFSTLHEAGHGMYEQGIDQNLAWTPLDRGASAGLHESQSRLWENVVGRSRECWEHFLPRLKERFPGHFDGVSLEEFHRAINKVERSLIRTDADEVTYNLHVILRFDFEVAMLEGDLEVRDLPEAWRGRMREDLGIEPPDDRDGVLQDAHWYDGIVGGKFQGYSLGNIMGAQLYAAALEAHPEVPEEISRGNFGTLHGWLKENVYRHGSKYTSEEILEHATGSGITTEPYLEYLRGKYTEIYDL